MTILLLGCWSREPDAADTAETADGAETSDTADSARYPQITSTDEFSLDMVEIGDSGQDAAYYDADTDAWVFGIADVDTAFAVDMTITVTDTAGNPSESAFATVDAL